MIKIIPFEREHLQAISRLNKAPDEIRGDAVTLLLKDQPIAVLGWFNLTAGVLQVWSYISEDAKMYPIAFHKSVNLLINFGFEKLPFRRMQMSVDCESSSSRRWAEVLGFECEAVMKKYGKDGKDYWLLARTKCSLS